MLKSRKQAPQPLIQRHTLTKIQNPLDALEIFEKGGMWRSNRMKDLLAAHASDNKIYNHIELQIPTAALDNDELTRNGAYAATLCRKLELAINEHFAKQLVFAETRVSYISNDDLDDQEIVMRFGAAIHIPRNEPLWAISGSADGLNYQPLGNIHIDQHLAILGSDEFKASMLANDWPFPDKTLCLSADPAKADLRLVPRPSKSLTAEFSNNLNAYIVSEAGSENARYYLKLERLVPFEIVTPKKEAELPPPAAIIIPASEEPGIFEYIVRDEQPAPALPTFPVAVDEEPSTTLAGEAQEGTILGMIQAQWQLSLRGLLLPRPSIYKRDTIDAYSVAFDRYGKLCQTSSHDFLFELQVDRQDNVIVSARSGSHRADPGEYLPLSGRNDAIKLSAAPTQSGTTMIVSLPDKQSITVTGGTPFSFGRSNPNARPLRVLRGENHIRGQSTLVGDRLGLSRDALLCEASEQGLQVTPGEGQTVLLLKDDFSFERELQGTELIAAGQLLAVGPYLLQVEAMS